MYEPTASPTELAAQTLAEKLLPEAAAREQSHGNSSDVVPLLKESGLLTAFIPARYGGQGAPFEDVMAAVREIATVDGSLAQIFGWHNVDVGFVRLAGTAEQQERFFGETVRGNLLWGNASSENVPRVIDWKVTAEPVDGGYRLNGTKHFCTGSQSADMLSIMAVVPGGGSIVDSLLLGMVSPDADGLTVNDDWNNMGQRRTESVTVTFSDVFMPAGDALGGPGAYFSRAYSTLFAPSAQTILSNVYLGRAIGALREAKGYTTSSMRPWPASGVDRATQDPYVLEQYGRLTTQLTAALAVADRAAVWTGRAWDASPEEFTWDDRGRLMVEVSQAKILSTEAALSITSQMFDVMGARATSAKYNVDRYWRDVRTLTLHDPLSYKFRDVGDWALNGTPPVPAFVS